MNLDSYLADEAIGEVSIKITGSKLTMSATSEGHGLFLEFEGEVMTWPALGSCDVLVVREVGQRRERGGYVGTVSKRKNPLITLAADEILFSHIWESSSLICKHGSLRVELQKVDEQTLWVRSYTFSTDSAS